MVSHEKYSWSDFPGEFMIYFTVMGAVHAAVFLTLCTGLAILAIRQRGTFLRRAGRVGLFIALMLTAGALGNGLWSCMVFGRLYFSTDYVLDFTPFWPVTQAVIDAPFGEIRGQLFGISLFQLQLLWLLFAASTWAAAIVSYQLVRRPRHSSAGGEIVPCR